MNHPDFDETIRLLSNEDRVSDNLAMDASPGTFAAHSKQFLGRELSAEDGEQFRAMLCTTDGLSRYFGQAILHRSTCDQRDEGGTLLTDHLLARDILPIVKACGLDKTTGLIPSEDMRSLPEQMDDCVDMGFHLMKMRNVINGPQYAEDAAQQMADIQKMAAENGNVAVFLEPEFDRDNDRSLPENAELMTTTLREMHQRIMQLGVATHPWFLKTSYPTQGKNAPEDYDYYNSAEAYQHVLTTAELPEDLFIVQLSGGHTSENARLLQLAVNMRQRTEGLWTPPRRAISTSYSRANLEQPCQKMFPEGARAPNVEAGQREILRQGFLNRLAQEGTYNKRFEEDYTIEQIWHEVNPD